MISHGGLLVIGIDKDNNNLLGLQNDFDTFSRNKHFDTWRIRIYYSIDTKWTPSFINIWKLIKKKTEKLFAIIIVKNLQILFW